MSLQNAYQRLNTKWANKLGTAYTQYRPTGPSNPVGPANQIGSINVLFDASLSLAFNAPNKFGNSLFAAILTPTAVQPCDYLIGAQGTFFIVSTEPLKPILAVQCNRVLSFSRQTTGQPTRRVYGGYAPGGDPLPLTNVPASVLNGTKGERNMSETLPDDSRMPWEIFLLPAFSGAPALRQSDHAVDDLGHRYTLSACELTGNTWRITAALVDV